MHKQLSLAFTVLIVKFNFFENSMKSDINSSENCVDPGSNSMQVTKCRIALTMFILDPGHYHK